MRYNTFSSDRIVLLSLCILMMLLTKTSQAASPHVEELLAIDNPAAGQSRDFGMHWQSIMAIFLPVLLVYQ